MVESNEEWYRLEACYFYAFGGARVRDERGLNIEKINIAPSAAESAIRGQKIVKDHELKVLEDDKSVNPRNVPYYLQLTTDN